MIKIPGYFDYQQFYDEVVKKLPKKSRCIEVGVYNGASAHYFLTKCKEAGKSTTLHLVDHFNNSSIYETLTYLKEFKDDIVIHPKNSSLAAFDMPDDSFDFIWLDADHSFQGLTFDLNNYFPKLNETGMIAGHDLSHPKYQVKDAVIAFFGARFYNSFSKSVWFRKKNHE